MVHSHDGELLSQNKGKKSLINRAAVSAQQKCTKLDLKSFLSAIVFDDFSGVVLEKDEGSRIAQALGPRKALILQNHGCKAIKINEMYAKITHDFLGRHSPPHYEMIVSEQPELLE
ncbi:2379_t:CDS:2 [Ambispora leptoticha]|uniref:2379_t:CDS:1 n=1 Tax=Ambispora leptoticha TaxID=144679 RepID=A0A9N9GM42_9GLOM|nr:2379_t:CDS:2 [Ambispora leptoticha]